VKKFNLCIKIQKNRSKIRQLILPRRGKSNE
jgi:hypothetical protein